MRLLPSSPVPLAPQLAPQLAPALLPMRLVPQLALVPLPSSLVQAGPRRPGSSLLSSHERCGVSVRWVAWGGRRRAVQHSPPVQRTRGLPGTGFEATQPRRACQPSRGRVPPATLVTAPAGPASQARRLASCAVGLEARPSGRSVSQAPHASQPAPAHCMQQAWAEPALVRFLRGLHAALVRFLRDGRSLRGSALCPAVGPHWTVGPSAAVVVGPRVVREARRLTARLAARLVARLVAQLLLFMNFFYSDNFRKKAAKKRKGA